jgi:outer membrane protein assembly factor BamB
MVRVMRAALPLLALSLQPSHITLAQVNLDTEWPTYRHDAGRTGTLPGAPASLSDPATVRRLAVRWHFNAPRHEPPPPPVIVTNTTLPTLHQFIASPIVVHGIVYIGSADGVMYALNAQNGRLIWQYPPNGNPPLVGTCAEDGIGNYGIRSSAAFTQIRGQDVVIFGAPDPDRNFDDGNGVGRLWALNAKSGALIWRSATVAHVTGCTIGALPPNQTGYAPQDNLPPELHEKIAYSSPLVIGNMVYIGVYGGDSPIQIGRVVAVNLQDGTLASPPFDYTSVINNQAPGIGGGVWNSPAADATAVYFTTGNVRTWGSLDSATNKIVIAHYNTEPQTNYGLSIVRVDPATGKVAWNFQPLPFPLDNDPDWNAGATIANTSCGEQIASVQKDGWSYGVNAKNGQCLWQYPDMQNPNCKFPVTDWHSHSYDGYYAPGAAWKDVFIVETGGAALPRDGVDAGWGFLHAMDICNTDRWGNRPGVRWMIRVPGASNFHMSTGAPSVSGGIVYVVTDEGHLVAIADKSIVPAAGTMCADIDYPSNICVAAHSEMVPVPTVLADITLYPPPPPPPPGTLLPLPPPPAFRREPALADNMVFVGTVTAAVFGLGPRP